LHILDQPKTFLALVAADAEPVRVQLYAALDAEVLLALDRRLHDAGVEAPHPEPKPRARELVS
jgi:hypothetical protein